MLPKVDYVEKNKLVRPAIFADETKHQLRLFTDIDSFGSQGMSEDSSQYIV